MAHEVVPGEDWGTLPTELHAQWKAYRCDEVELTTSMHDVLVTRPTDEAGLGADDVAARQRETGGVGAGTGVGAGAAKLANLGWDSAVAGKAALAAGDSTK